MFKFQINSVQLNGFRLFSLEPSDSETRISHSCGVETPIPLNLVVYTCFCSFIFNIKMRVRGQGTARL